ncbi:MAG: MotA/TolQ/ExbB proton channel family protein [Sedimentisphaerales bacterium]|nr:MotA/TolQ/ExbB proton channel family protein [Sedimentisphaerales bacterium]
MSKNFWLKTFILVIMLAGVAAVIFVTMRGLAITEPKHGEGRTLLEQFVTSGGWVVWFILLPMSFVTVYLAVEHGLTIRRKKLLPDGIGRHIIETIQQFGPRHLPASVADKDDFVSIAVFKAVTEGIDDWFRMRNLLAESLQEQVSRLLRRIEWLNLIGNVSPMVGLFGTVVGMIKLFNVMAASGGQPEAAQLADGISVALVTTFWGLLIAIPALALHGVFANRIETLANDAVAEAENIIPEIRRSLKQSQTEELKLNQPIREIAGKPKGSVSQNQPMRR